MKKNPSMSDENWNWFQLSLSARNLTAAEIKNIKHALKQNPNDMDSRVQLFSYYNQLSKNDYEHPNAEAEVFEHVLWLVSNKPGLTGAIGHRCSTQAIHFNPKNFATIRQVWLEQVERNSSNVNIVGNAGNFIIWKDYERGAALLERAHILQPSGTWLGWLVIHCASQIYHLPSLYTAEMQKRVVDIGCRALKAGDPDASFLTAEYVADAAFELGQYDVVKKCAEHLNDWEFANLKHLSKIYLAMIALRQGDKQPALKIALEVRTHFERPDKIYKLATELLAVGERTAVIQMVHKLKGKTKKIEREKWLHQLENNEVPDFR